MQIQVTGKQIDVGAALRTHATRELSAMGEKYAGRPTDAQVVFTRDAHRHVCEIVLHLSSGLTARARAAADEPYAGFERCREKLDKQLRRHKRRLKDHQKVRPQPVETSPAASYILAGGEEDATAADDLKPVIIAETETRVPTLSVGEAVMQMELNDAALLVFRNEKSGNVNVVHRRDDGNVGWIDT